MKITETGVDEFEAVAEALVQTALEFAQTDEGRASGFQGYEDLPTDYDYSGSMHEDRSAKADVENINFDTVQTPSLNDVVDIATDNKRGGSDNSDGGHTSGSGNDGHSSSHGHDGSSSSSGRSNSDNDSKGRSGGRRGKGGLLLDVASELVDEFLP